MVSLRLLAPALVLGALVTGAVFLLARGAPVVALSLVSVVVIAASLYLMLSPSEPDAVDELLE